MNCYGISEEEKMQLVGMAIKTSSIIRRVISPGGLVSQGLNESSDAPHQSVHVLSSMYANLISQLTGDL